MKFDLPRFVKNLDFFGAPIQFLNLRGETNVKTSAGACLSMFISALTLSFAMLKFEHLYTRKNPTLIMTETTLEEGTIYETGKSDFMIAFAAEHWDTGFKDDPRYIQWTVLFQKFVDNVETKAWYPVHQCTDEEFARFHRVDDESAIKVARLQAAGQFKCIDWQE